MSLMTNNSPVLDVKNLCSRKLFELLCDRPLSHQQQYSVEQELLARQHYLPEMRRLRATHPALIRG